MFRFKRPSSGNYQLGEITKLHGLTRQDYHDVTACRRISEIYARTSLTLKLALLKCIFPLQCNNFLLQFV
jgi:hypothetical protein